MSMDFPVPTAVGETYTNAAGITYKWDGTAWVAQGSAGGSTGPVDFPVDSVNGKTGDVVLNAVDVGAAPTVHTHVIADVTNLQTSLDGKAPVVHNHDGVYAPAVHNHDADYVNVTGDTMTGPLVIEANTDAPALRVTQTGTGYALRVEDSASPDTTPFVVDMDGNLLMSGNLGINNANPVAPLDIKFASSDLRFFIADNTNTVQLNSVNNANNALKDLNIQGKNIRLKTMSTERIHIDNGGSVGFNVPANTVMAMRIRGKARSATDYGIWVENSAPEVLLSIDTLGKFITGQSSSSPYNLTTATPANVYVDGSGTLYRSTSSAKYKTDIEPLDHAIVDRAVSGLIPVWYRTKTPNGDDKASWSHIGLLAEDVAKVEPRLVVYKTKDITRGEDGEFIETERAVPEPEGVDYARLSVILLDKVRRQQAVLDSLEARIAALETPTETPAT